VFRGLDAAAAVALIAVILVMASLIFLGGRDLDLSFYGRDWDSGPYEGVILVLFLQAAGVSLTATALSFLLGLGLGFTAGWARTLRLTSWREVREDGRFARALLRALARRAASRVASFYVEIVRGTPLFVQIVLIWSIFLTAFPDWDQNPRNLLAGLTALTLNTGGYQAEIFRAGFQSVPPGQIEAANSIGLNPRQTMRRVILPQALRLTLPPLTNEFISLFKSSSLLFVISVAELTDLAKSVAFVNPQVFEIFLLLTAMYLLVTLPLGRVAQSLERRYRMAGLGLGPARAARGVRGG